MKRKNLTRNALFTSIMSLLLCVSMLVGTTFAWFTDSVASGVNTITAGNLDVELYHGKTPDPTTKVGKDTKLFTDTKDVEIELWEPGVVAYTNLKVANEGNLALKYQMALNFEEATATADGKTLADVLKVAVVEDGVKGTTRETVLEEAKRSANQFTLDTFYLAEKLEKAENSETYGLVIYWEPDTDYTDGNTDNLYNMNNGETTVLSIKLGIHLFATQLEMEEDSFGPDYDENLWDDAMVVLSEEDLIAALAAGETAIKLDDNITVDGPLVIPEGNTVALDLNGMDLSTTDPATGYAINNLGTLTLMDSQAGASTFNSRSIKARGIYNGYDPAGNHVTTAKLTILSGEYNAMGTNGGAAVYNYGTVEIKGGTFTSNGGYALNNQKTGKMTVSNASVTGGIYNLGDLIVSDSAVYQHISGRHAIYNNEAKLVINSGEFDSESGNELILADGQNSSVVINGGTFDKTAKSWLFGAATGKNISFVIKGGVFNGYVNMPENTVDTIRPYGDPIVVTGGTFNFDPTNWVDSGYKAVQNSNGTYTVLKGDAVANSDAALKDALTNGEDNIALGAGAFTMPGTSGDVTITGTKDTVITITTPTANNVTLNGVTVVAGSYKGIQHSDTVVFENCTLKGSQFLYANHVVIKNCVIDLTETADYIWTYSAKNVEFIDCTFNTLGKAILMYNEGPDLVTNVSVKGCTFNATESAGKAAIEIGSKAATNGHYTLTTENNTVDANFTGEWRIKDSATNNTTVNGVIYNYVADGLYKGEGVEYYVYNANGLATLNEMMANKTAGRDTVVNLLADIDFTGKTWTPVDSHADTAFEIAEINGNGHTISNLTVNGQAMFTRFSGFDDVVIKDITFDNATVNSNGNINTSILTGHSYQNVLLDNVDVKNSSITGGYKVAPLIGTVYNESTSSITATLKNCDVENVVVTATVYDFCTTGMVAFVYEGNNDTVKFENCTVSNVQLKAKPNGYESHAWIYVNDAETDDCFNEALGVTVTNCTFEAI